MRAAAAPARPLAPPRRRAAGRRAARARAAPQSGGELSPGAGLPTAEAQADAAFADLLETSHRFGPRTADTERPLEEVAAQVAQAAQEEFASEQSKSRGLVGDLGALFNALKGGAHITRRKDGSI